MITDILSSAQNSSALLNSHHPPRYQTITQKNSQHDTNPLPFISRAVSILRQHAFAVNLALRCQRGHVHALAIGPAVVDTRAAKFVDHHAAEDVGLLLFSMKRGC